MRFLTRILRAVTTVGGVALLLWLMRDRMVNLPVRRGERVPAFRSAPPAHEPPPAEVTAIPGIGPVYAERLAAAGIHTIEELTRAGAGTVAEAAGVSVSMAGTWIERTVNRAR